MNFTSLEKEYTDLISTMEVRLEWKDAIDRRARAILANKARYQEVSNAMGGLIPWSFIGVIHSLEAGLSFDGVLHNGEKILGTGKKTKLVPKGRGPFTTWEEAAIDALKIKKLDQITDWTDERICYELERFNGFGYQSRNINSPYLWSGSNHYTIGKFVSDGKFVKTAKSAQSGAWLLVARIREIDIPAKEVVSLSSKLGTIKSVRNWFAGVSLSGMVAEFFQLMEPIKEFIVENKWIFVGATTAGVIFILTKLLKKGVREYQEGRYIPSGQVK